MDVRLCPQDPQGDLQDAFTEEFGRIVGLHEITTREDVEKLCLAPVCQMQAVLFEILHFCSFLDSDAADGDMWVIVRVLGND